MLCLRPGQQQLLKLWSELDVFQGPDLNSWSQAAETISGQISCFSGTQGDNKFKI